MMPARRYYEDAADIIGLAELVGTKTTECSAATGIVLSGLDETDTCTKKCWRGGTANAACDACEKCDSGFEPTTDCRTCTGECVHGARTIDPAKVTETRTGCACECDVGWSGVLCDVNRCTVSASGAIQVSKGLGLYIYIYRVVLHHTHHLPNYNPALTPPTNRPAHTHTRARRLGPGPDRHVHDHQDPQEVRHLQRLRVHGHS